MVFQGNLYVITWGKEGRGGFPYDFHILQSKLPDQQLDRICNGKS